MQHLIFEGGGVAGIAHLGVLQALGQDSLNSIETVAGSSAGAVIAALVAIKVPVKDMEKLVKEIDFNTCIPLIPQNPLIAAENSYRLMRQFGLIDSTLLYYKFESIIERYTLTSKITFKQLYTLTKIKLTLTATNISIGKTVYFNHILTPNISVSKVIQMSISYPIVFTPIRYKNQYYIDGGVLANLPLASLDKECERSKTLCSRLSNYENNSMIKIKSFVNYLQALIWQTVLKHARMNNMQNIALNEFSYVDINVNHISTFEQNLDIDELLQLGRDAYKRYVMN